MKQQSTFVGWDFATTWKIDEGIIGGVKKQINLAVIKK